MWAMEYNPNNFLLYETSAADATTADINGKLLRTFGKFERNNVKIGTKDYHCALAVFLAASIIENRQKQILKEAKGVDDVVEVSLSLSLSLVSPFHVPSSLFLLSICLPSKAFGRSFYGLLCTSLSLSFFLGRVAFNLFVYHVEYLQNACHS